MSDLGKIIKLIRTILTISTNVHFNGVLQESFQRHAARNLIKLGLNQVQWPTSTNPEGRQQVPRVRNHVALAFLPIHLRLNNMLWQVLWAIIKITSN